MSRPRLVTTPSSTAPAPSIAPPADHTGYGRRRVDLVAVNAAMHRLIEDRDPAVVFGHLAELCVPAVCDSVSVDFLDDMGVARIRRAPVRSGAERPAAGSRSPGTATVDVPSDAGRTVGTDPVDYVVRLTCTWRDHQPTPADVALIELLGRCAAGTVRQARQSSTAPTGTG